MNLDAMGEMRFFNASDADNVTSSLNLSSSSTDESPLSRSQLYTCALYQFLVTGIIQLIVSIIGLVGKSVTRLEVKQGQ